MSLFDDLLNPQKSQNNTSTAATGTTSNGIIITSSEPMTMSNNPLNTGEHQTVASTTESSSLLSPSPVPTPTPSSPIIITESSPLVSSSTPVDMPATPSPRETHQDPIIMAEQASTPIVEVIPEQVQQTESPLISSSLLDMSQSEPVAPSILDMSDTATSVSPDASMGLIGDSEEDVVASYDEALISVESTPTIEHTTPVDTEDFIKQALKEITDVRASIEDRHKKELALAEEYRAQKEEYTTRESEALARAEAIIEDSKQAEAIFKYLMEQLRTKSTGVTIDTAITSEESTPTPPKKTRSTVATTLTELGTREIVANTIDDTPVTTEETVVTAEESYSLI